MKIELQQALEKLEKFEEVSKTEQVSQSKQTLPSDKVLISKEVQVLNKALEIATDQTVNLERVKELQDKIDKGSYKVDMDAVSDAILKEHLFMS